MLMDRERQVSAIRRETASESLSTDEKVHEGSRAAREIGEATG